MNRLLDRRSWSFLVVGFLVGVLVTTVGLAFTVRQSSRAGQGGEQTVLKLAHSLDTNHPVHDGLVFMADRLAERSSGSVTLQIFPNGQLGSETECLEQLQRGALAMTKTSTAPMESFVSDMAVFSVPYVFRDADHCWRVLESDIGERLLDAGAQVGLRGLCYFDAGCRSFYTIEHPVRSPADLKGLLIRVQKSKTSMDMVEALGGAPTPIPWGELYTALQQKRIDGAENNLPSFHTNRHFEVCKHLTLDEHTIVPDLLVVSEPIWSRLPANVQQWVRESAAEASLHQRALWAKATKEALAAVQDHGVTIYQVDKQAFADSVASMHQTYVGTSVGDLIADIKATP
ncbi:MAG: TRAP transporter substrate-binding protein [Planctomycetota bacterium]